MELDVRAMQSSQALELYITARPTEARIAAGREARMFGAIAELLLRNKAWICQERIFAPRGEVAALREARRHAYGELADGIEPAFLAAEDAPGVMPGVQVYAVAMPERPTIICAGGAQGRLFGFNGCRWLTAGGLRAPEAVDGPAQARAVFQKAQALLREAGGDLRALARTWVFIDDVLSWYGEFNQARSSFFREHGLMGLGAAGCFPASTGIGVSPAEGSRCSIDLLAVIGPEGSVTRHAAAGRQRSANEYGSAFARATVARTPAGKTAFVSGTAAIDAAGVTCCRNDIAGQIQMTMQNVHAVLRQLSVDGGDVVQAMAYCANGKVREEFGAYWRRQAPWPWLVMIGDVCRSGLLFEVEVTACVGAKKLA
jgi:enamine deaminase RidA (YjgF/YER057c/UK114 family)